jgi:hypothetical protein
MAGLAHHWRPKGTLSDLLTQAWHHIASPLSSMMARVDASQSIAAHRGPELLPETRSLERYPLFSGIDVEPLSAQETDQGHPELARDVNGKAARG